jgi:hypothetical protein
MSFIPTLPLSSNEKGEYAHLMQEDADGASIDTVQGHYSPQRIAPSKLHRTLVFAGKGLLLFLSVWGLVALYKFGTAQYQAAHLPRERFAAGTWPSCSCGGTTTARARELGCIFTPLAIAWLPPHCIDTELSDDFDKQGPGPNGEWDYWADANMTRRLTREETGELANVDGVFYATQEWHVTHCIFTWQKHYRSRWTGTTIERRSNGLDHIQHCEGVFRMRDGLQEIRTVAGIALDADDPGEVTL